MSNFLQVPSPAEWQKNRKLRVDLADNSFSTQMKGSSWSKGQFNRLKLLKAMRPGPKKPKLDVWCLLSHDSRKQIEFSVTGVIFSVCVDQQPCGQVYNGEIIVDEERRKVTLFLSPRDIHVHNFHFQSEMQEFEVTIQYAGSQECIAFWRFILCLSHLKPGTHLLYITAKQPPSQKHQTVSVHISKRRNRI